MFFCHTYLLINLYDEVSFALRLGPMIPAYVVVLAAARVLAVAAVLAAASVPAVAVVPGVPKDPYVRTDLKCNKFAYRTSAFRTNGLSNIVTANTINYRISYHGFNP